MLMFREKSWYGSVVPAGGVNKVEKGRSSALLTYRKAVFWRWPRGDGAENIVIPGRSSHGPVLPSGDIKKVEKGR